MEIELKYLLRDQAQADEIMDSRFIYTLRVCGSEEIIPMKAVYFDTPSRAFEKAKIGFRIRKEGSEYVATVKEKGSSENGMHRRVEVNITLPEDTDPEKASIELFKGTEVYDDLREASAGEPLESIVVMEFTRRQAKLDTGLSVSEISVDKGVMRAGGKEAPIMELEIELKKGDEKDMTNIGDVLSRMYSLKPENDSKLKRALAMAE
ncbi:MAG: inorganic triphosphatase [Anaerovoracaceae bacterium]